MKMVSLTFLMSYLKDIRNQACIVNGNFLTNVLKYLKKNKALYYIS